MFESSRRIEWQLLLRGLRLTEAEEPCPKCGCFWRGHDMTQCHGVGTREDNLWVTHEHFYPEVLRILKEIVSTRGTAGNPPCPLCDDEDPHDWLECMRMVRYSLLELLDCEVAMRPPMGPSEVIWLQANPLLWIEDNVDGNPIVKSHIPPCRFCKQLSPAHFPLECAQVWEEWEICRYPCYKCQQDGSDHVSEECWVIGDRQQMRQDLIQGLEERAKQIGFHLDWNQCPLCLKSLLHNWHMVEECLEDHSRTLINPLVQSVPKNEVTWKIYGGDIEITQTWSKLASGLKQCGFCKQKWLLHYPKEMPKRGTHSSSLYVLWKRGTGSCPRGLPQERCRIWSQRCRWAIPPMHLVSANPPVPRDLLYLPMSDIPNGHVEKCLGAKIVPANEGWAPPWVHVDMVVGSGLPQCSYCGQARPLHYPGDCNWALYEADWMPCLVCGSDGHVPEECPPRNLGSWPHHPTRHGRCLSD